MKNNKFIIKNTDEEDLYIQWYDANKASIIIFDTKEEANEFIETHFYLFEGVNFKIIEYSENYKFHPNCINFKDIINTEQYKKECVYEV